MLSTELRNEIMRRVATCTPPSSHRGRPRLAPLAFVLERIFWVLETGCQWRRVPVGPIAAKTVYHYFRIWAKQGLFEKVFYTLAQRVPCSGYIVDTTFVKNVYGSDVLGRNPTDRGRNATKVSLITNLSGTPLCSTFHRANKNDCTTLRHTLSVLERKVGIAQTQMVHADKGYDSVTCRVLCSQKGLRPNIAQRRRNSAHEGKERYAVEQTFGLIDRFRRIIVRYDASITSFKSFWFLACAAIVARR